MSKGRISELQKENQELKDSLPTLETQAVEKFCSMEGPFVKICDSFVAGFLRAQELALQQPDKVSSLELPKDMGVSPDLEAKILEKKGDAFAILQLIREEEPDLLARWETGQAPEFGGEDNVGGGQ